MNYLSHEPVMPTSYGVLAELMFSQYSEAHEWQVELNFKIYIISWKTESSEADENLEHADLS